MITAAQSIYHREHGSYAVSFDELTNLCRQSTSYQFGFASDGTRWSVAVPPQNMFAGHYLLTTEGRIHFSTEGEATTNSVDLIDQIRR